MVASTVYSQLIRLNDAFVILIYAPSSVLYFILSFVFIFAVYQVIINHKSWHTLSILDQELDRRGVGARK